MPCCAGGCYDGVGAVFGPYNKLDRERPAVGFSLDVKQLARAASAPLRAAVRAPWSDAPGLQAAVQALRARGETVVCACCPAAPARDPRINRDRELIEAGGQWVIQSL